MAVKTELFVVVSVMLLVLCKVRARTILDDDLIVELAKPASKIQGHILKSDEGIDFYAFQDIPYAKPPIGRNRFKPPSAVDPWDGILDATSNRRVCPQDSDPFNSDMNSLKPHVLPENEDCLVLNVYSPVKPGSNASLAVYFWIHGGGWVFGSGSEVDYDPKYLIDYDIVIVTINYRLGAFGFLTTNDENLPGNLGYKDQHFALQWTNDNIHLFGGDPKKITLGGESAGSMAAGIHLRTPLNKGLMRGVIQQSGSAFSSYTYQEDYNKWAFRMGAYLDSSFNSTSSKDLLELLLSAPQENIMQAQLHLQRESDIFGGGYMIILAWTPIIESESVSGAIVTENLHGDFSDGKFNLVPLFIGFNSEEALLYYNSVSNETFNRAARFFDNDPRRLISTKLNIAEENREIAGKALKALYTNSSFEEDRYAFVRYTTDDVYIRAILREAEAAVKFVPVYLYELSWVEWDSEIPGVEHANDLVYFWQDPATSIFPFVKELRKPLLKLWTNFIKTQNPTPEKDEDLQNIEWPLMEANAPLRYLNINKTFGIEENPRQYDKLKAILDKYIQPPYNAY